MPLPEDQGRDPMTTKRLVICCDGTWNSADQEKGDEPCPTNVVRLAYRVAKRDMAGRPQVVFYDQGVGTGNSLDRFTGGAFGRGLEDNIHDAYRFLIANYEEGDEIFLFGFSRGAFTARSLAGMIRNCGILRRDKVSAYRTALNLYRDESRRPDHPESLRFRHAHCVTGDSGVPVRFVGVWDTVGSLGIPLRGLRSLTRQKYQFHDAELSGSVEAAYHALAIDERRAPFSPSVWDYKPKPSQRVQQVWFCGVHSDVGGGYAERGLSDLSLEWMLEKARGEGLALDGLAVAGNPMSPDPHGPLHNSKKGMYRVTPGEDRTIGLDGTHWLHWSAMQRYREDASYRPKPLVAYLQRVGTPQVEQAVARV
jgi:uncharacterized protein (DUF2235 family)